MTAVKRAAEGQDQKRTPTDARSCATKRKQEGWLGGRATFLNEASADVVLGHNTVAKHKNKA